MPARPPSLKAIAAFEAAARHQSFTKAASELHLTHGAVSHAVRTLEQRLGCELFKREGRGVLLTESGRVFAGRVRLSLGLLTSAFETRPWLERSRLLISALPAFAQRVLVPRLSQFYAAHPDVSIELRATSTLESMGATGVDVGIRYGPGAWAGLSAAKIADETLFPVMAPRTDPPPPTKPEDLLNERLICHKETPWVHWFAAAGLSAEEPQGPLVLDESLLALDAAAIGLGVALGRSVLAASDLRAGRLIRPFSIAAPSPYSYWLVWNPTSPKQELIATFLNWLRSQVDELAAPSLMPQAGA